MEIKPSMFTEVNCLGERTYTAAEVAELKAQCAAKIQDIVTLFAKVKASCPEDNSFGSAQRLGITVCIEIAESSIPTEYATALAEHDEQLKQAFSKECARFHEEGRKCVTCGREDIAELKAQCAAMLEKAARKVNAQTFHELYEDKAVRYKYQTRKESAVPWESVPENNRLLMEEVCGIIRESIFALIPTDHADALAEHYQRSREQGWQEAIKLIQTGTKSYQGQWPTALRDALAEVKRQARFEAENLCKRALLRAIKERGTENAAGHYDEYLAALRAEGDKQP